MIIFHGAAALREAVPRYGDRRVRIGSCGIEWWTPHVVLHPRITNPNSDFITHPTYTTDPEKAGTWVLRDVAETTISQNWGEGAEWFFELV